MTKQKAPLTLTDEERDDPIKALRKLNRKYMDLFDHAAPNQKVVILRSYDIQTQYEEALVQMAIDKYESVKLSNTEEAKVRGKMAAEAAKGVEIETPAEEAKWEAKLEAARKKDQARVQAEKDRRATQFAKEKAKAPADTPKKGEKKSDEDSLSSVTGLGKKSVAKLMAAEVKTATEFHALSHEQKVTLVGPVVANMFKDK